jgi:aminopeptidase N
LAVSLTIETPGADARDLLTQVEAAARAAAVSQVRYDLRLDLTANAATFRGHLVARFTLAAGHAGSIFLCFRGRTIHALTLNGVAIDVPDWNGYRLTLPAAHLKGGAENILDIAFENAYDTGGDGVFRFIDPEDQAEYVYTNFEPYEAHRMAPIFDQPDVKAKLSLTVTAPSAWSVFANGAETEARPDGAGVTLHTFAETPPLASYLFSFAAGPFVGRRFEVSIPGRATPVQVGLWSRGSLERYLSYDLFQKMTSQAFLYFGELFGREYPFEKLDHVYCPEFNVGAMENVGLITYTERYIFRSTPTPSDVTDLAEVVFHEIAHMWFGNLVTMRWWDDLWLNESFATYAAALCLTEGSEHTTAWQEFNVQLKRWSLIEDDSPTTHPIAGTVADTDQTFLNFDGITYGKGGAVLKQLGARLGRAGFSAGLRLHFQRHAFGNATLADFLASLEEGSGISLATWSDQWLRTSGPNRLGALITPSTSGTIGSLTVTQEVVSGDEVLREHLLRVALLYPGDGAAVIIEPHEVLATGARTDVPSAVGRPLPLAVIPNHDDLAVGKLALDDATLRFAESRLEAIPDGLLRQLTWMAIWELVRDGRYPSARYAQLLIDRLPHEVDSSIVQGIVESTLGSLLLRYMPDGERERWGSRIVETARARLAAGGSEGMRIVWSRVMVLAAVTPRDVEETWQVAVGETPLDGVEIDQDHRWSLLIRAASFGAPNIVERLKREALRDPSDRGERALLAAEAATPNVAAKRATWGRILRADGYGSVRKTLAAASGFAWPWQHELLAPYVAQIPTALLALGSADATFARDLVTRSASLGLWGAPSQMRAAIDLLLKNIASPTHEIPPVDAARLRRFALLERDGVMRVLRQQDNREG